MKKTNKKHAEHVIGLLNAELSALADRKFEIVQAHATTRSGSPEDERGKAALSTNDGSTYATITAIEAIEMVGTLEAVQTRLLNRLLRGDTERTINNIGFRNSTRAALHLSQILSENERERFDKADAADQDSAAALAADGPSPEKFPTGDQTPLASALRKLSERGMDQG